MSDTPPLNPEDPIDAEFEPATPKPRTRSENALGWPALVSLGLAGASFLLAFLALGWIPGMGASSDQSETRIAALEASLEKAEASRSELLSRIETMQTVNQQNRTSNRRLEDQFTDFSERLEQSEITVDAVAAAIKAVEAAQANMVTATDETGAPVVAEINPLILSRLEALETTLEGFDPEAETNRADPELLVELAALRADLKALQEAEATRDAAASEVEQQSAGSSAEAALALSAIEAAARRGRPFLTAYQQLLTALPENAAVEALAPLSISGAPTMADLRVRFAPLKRAALDEDARTAGGGAGLMRSIFGDGIKVRREGAENVVDQLDEAEAALAENNLTRAISLVKSLPEPVQTVFTDWLSSAVQRESLETALEALRLTMIAEDR